MNYRDLLTDWKYQLVILVALLFIYLISPDQFKPIVGIFAGLYIVGSFLYETASSAKKKGLMEEAKSLAISLVIIIALFLTLRVILDTPTPISAVVSCSMVPSINRGDLIILMGSQDYYSLMNIETDPLPLFSPNTNVFYNGSFLGTINGSVFSYCNGRFNSLCNEFRSSPNRFYEVKGPIRFNYGQCSRETSPEPCIVSIEYGGKKLNLNSSLGGDVIIYRPKEGTLFSSLGDIIHRAIVSINWEGKTYFLTKGDNNNIFDIQFYLNGKYNLPPEKKDVLGRVLFKVPFLGYYKIFITPYLTEDPYCDRPLTIS